jgi:hypothetical protein
MREICASGSVGGEGGNALAYPASTPAILVADPLCGTGKSGEVGNKPTSKLSFEMWAWRAL